MTRTGRRADAVVGNWKMGVSLCSPTRTGPPAPAGTSRDVPRRCTPSDALSCRFGPPDVGRQPAGVDAVASSAHDAAQDGPPALSQLDAARHLCDAAPTDTMKPWRRRSGPSAWRPSRPPQPRCSGRLAQLETGLHRSRTHPPWPRSKTFFITAGHRRHAGLELPRADDGGHQVAAPKAGRVIPAFRSSIPLLAVHVQLDLRRNWM